VWANRGIQHPVPVLHDSLCTSVTRFSLPWSVYSLGSLWVTKQRLMLQSLYVHISWYKFRISRRIFMKIVTGIVPLEVTTALCLLISYEPW